MSTSTALTTYSREYVAQKALFSLFGGTFRMYGKDGSLQFFIKQKAFKLAEEINVFADEEQTTKRMSIKARGWGDFSGTYDIVDADTGEKVGSAKRAGLKSMFRDEWSILDDKDEVVGQLVETGGMMILIRKFFKIIPQKYEVTYAGALEGTIHQQFNPFRLAYDVDFGKGAGKLDPRLGVGLTVLLLAVEGAKD